MNAGAIVLAGGVVVVGGLAVTTSRGKARHLELAAGVHPALRALMSAWDLVGTHVVDIAPADTAWPYPGGLRTDENLQAAAAGDGLSKAVNLASTPHGRGAALDVWPQGFDPFKGFDVQPSLEPLFRVFGEWAESQSVLTAGQNFTFRWGGRFRTPDLPHVELVDWLALQYPPPDYRGVA